MITTSYKLALNELLRGGVVAVPTETVYGLAADIRNPHAIASIFKTKDRPEFDPLIVHIADTKDVVAVAREFPPLARKLADAFWPGPLTIVLPRLPQMNPMITSGYDTVAVRIPNQTLTRTLIRDLGGPIAAPSANRFGHTSPTTAQHVESEFSGRVLVLDGGPCGVGIESTVVRVHPKKISILRPGAVTAEDLAKFAAVEPARQNSESPGHLIHHYMPDIPLVVFQNGVTTAAYEFVRMKLGKNVLHPAWMELPSEPVTAARLLYANMRAAAASADVNCLFLDYPIRERRSHLWAGISDRIEKAATLTV